MPTTLPNGLVIWNATPHDLHFWCRKELEIVTAPSDEVVNVKTWNDRVLETEKYELTKVSFYPTKEGRELIQRIKLEYPEALIVGSIIAADAYRGDVVASIPEQSRRYNKNNRLVRYDRFTVYEESENQNGSSE